MELQQKRYFYGIAGIIIAAGLWGMQGVLLLPNLSALPVDFVVLGSYGLPLIFLMLFQYKEFRKFKDFTSKEIIALVIIGAFGGVVGTMAIVKALFYVNFNNLSVVVLIQKTQPIFAIILARIILKEKINSNFYIWALPVGIGVYLMTFGFSVPSIDLKDSMLMACLLAILSAACFASNTVFGRYLAKNQSHISITFYRYLFTTIFALLVVVLGSQAYGFTHVTKPNMVIFILIAITSGPLSMFIYYYGLTYVKASISSICELSLPITAVLIEYFVYGKIFSSVQWLGALILIYGIFKITQTKSK